MVNHRWIRVPTPVFFLIFPSSSSTRVAMPLRPSTVAPDEKCIKLISLDFPACTLFILLEGWWWRWVQCPDGWVFLSHVTVALCVCIHFALLQNPHEPSVIHFPSIPHLLIYFLPLWIMNITRCLLNLTHRCESNRKSRGGRRKQ